MAKTHPQHQSFNSGFSSQYLHHIGSTTASLGRPLCPHYERSPPFEETVLRRTVSGQSLPKRPEKALQRHTGAKVCEVRRNAATELRRKLRKGTVTSATAAIIPCSHCPRPFCAHLASLVNCGHMDPVIPSSITRLIRWSSSITMNKEEGLKAKCNVSLCLSLIPARTECLVIFISTSHEAGFDTRSFLKWGSREESSQWSQGTKLRSQSIIQLFPFFIYFPVFIFRKYLRILLPRKCSARFLPYIVKEKNSDTKRYNT